MPVRVVIHSSLVSTSWVRSSFATASAGRDFPQPMIAQPTSHSLIESAGENRLRMMVACFQAIIARTPNVREMGI